MGDGGGGVGVSEGRVYEAGGNGVHLWEGGDGRHSPQAVGEAACVGTQGATHTEPESRPTLKQRTVVLRCLIPITRTLDAAQLAAAQDLNSLQNEV